MTAVPMSAVLLCSASIPSVLWLMFPDFLPSCLIVHKAPAAAAADATIMRPPPCTASPSPSASASAASAASSAAPPPLCAAGAGSCAWRWPPSWPQTRAPQKTWAAQPPAGGRAHCMDENCGADELRTWAAIVSSQTRAPQRTWAAQPPAGGRAHCIDEGCGVDGGRLHNHAASCGGPAHCIHEGVTAGSKAEARAPLFLAARGWARPWG